MNTTVLKVMTIPAATLVVAIALGGLFAPATVRAGEYCTEDDYSFTRTCSFSSMEQCKAAISGTDAACLRDPFLKDDSIETINHSSAVPSRAHRKRSALRSFRCSSAFPFSPRRKTEM
jgi:Protein of unknown function (DUF3551)